MDIARDICTDSFYIVNSGLPCIPVTAVHKITIIITNFHHLHLHIHLHQFHHLYHLYHLYYLYHQKSSKGIITHQGHISQVG